MTVQTQLTFKLYLAAFFLQLLSMIAYHALSLMNQLLKLELYSVPILKSCLWQSVDPAVTELNIIFFGLDSIRSFEPEKDLFLLFRRLPCK